MELQCYPMTLRPPDIVPGRGARDWMDKHPARHPYKCLPLTMANTTGWEILCPVGFSAEWNGGDHTADITIIPDRPHPDFHHFATSHFAGGVITIHPGWMFRTPPGWAVWTSGPPNHIKDGIQPLTGLVETDWLPFPFTMNWRFTRPGLVRFAKGEPFCFITLMEHRRLDAVQPVMRTLESDMVLKGQFDAWTQRRTEFNAGMAKRDPATIKEAWQRFYFKGEFPDDTGAPAADHVNKRRLKPMKVGF